MKTLFMAVIFYVLTTNAYADGLPLTNGRYVQNPVLILKLTEEQKTFIDNFRKCHLENFKKMNQFTPYVFTLTDEQATTLKKKKGFSPRWFEVYETYRGFNDAGPHWNLALRFSIDEIEIPLNLVLPENEAKEAHDDQGWDEVNPCVQPNPAFKRDALKRAP